MHSHRHTHAHASKCEAKPAPCPVVSRSERATIAQELEAFKPLVLQGTEAILAPWMARLRQFGFVGVEDPFVAT